MFQFINTNKDSKVHITDYLKLIPSAYRAMVLGFIAGLSPEIKIQTLNEKEAIEYWDSHYRESLEKCLLRLKDTTAINVSSSLTIANNVFVTRNIITSNLYFQAFLNSNIQLLNEKFPWLIDNMLNLVYDCLYKLTNSNKLSLLEVYNNYYNNPVNNVKIIEEVITNSNWVKKPLINDFDALIKYIINFSNILFNKDIFYSNTFCQYQEVNYNDFYNEIFTHDIFPYKIDDSFYKVVLDSSRSFIWTFLDTGNTTIAPSLESADIEVKDDYEPYLNDIEDIQYNQEIKQLSDEFNITNEEINYQFKYLDKLGKNLSDIENNQKPTYSLEDINSNYLIPYKMESFSLEDFSQIISVVITFLNAHMGKIIGILFTILVTIITRWAFSERKDMEVTDTSGTNHNTTTTPPTEHSQNNSPIKPIVNDPEIVKEEFEKKIERMNKLNKHYFNLINTELALLISHQVSGYTAEDLLTAIEEYSILVSDLLINYEAMVKHTENIVSKSIDISNLNKPVIKSQLDSINTEINNFYLDCKKYYFRDYIDIYDYMKYKGVSAPYSEGNPIYGDLNEGHKKIVNENTDLLKKFFLTSKRNNFSYGKHNPPMCYSYFKTRLLKAFKPITEYNILELEKTVKPEIEKYKSLKEINKNKANTLKSKIFSQERIAKTKLEESKKLLQTLIHKYTDSNATKVISDNDRYIIWPNIILPTVNTFTKIPNSGQYSVHTLKRELLGFHTLHNRQKYFLAIKNIIVDISIVINYYHKLQKGYTTYTRAETIYNDLEANEIIRRSKEKQEHGN